MTPEERTLLDDLFRRLRQADAQPRDPDVERHIREAIQGQPAAPYYMAQSLLVQEHALTAAQQRIEELERQLKEAQQPKPQSGGVGSFLGGALGFGRPAAPPPAPPPTPAPAPMAQPSPWGAAAQRPAAPPQGYYPPQQPAPGFGGWGGAPAGAYPPPARGGGFMGGALQTAAGVAGGVLAASAISSLLHNSGSPFGDAGASHAASHGAAPAPDPVLSSDHGLPPDNSFDPAPDTQYASYEDDGSGFGGDDEGWA